MDKCGDKAVGNPNNRYDSNECKVYDVAVRVTATVQEIKPVYRYENTYKVKDKDGKTYEKTTYDNTSSSETYSNSYRIV